MLPRKQVVILVVKTVGIRKDIVCNSKIEQYINHTTYLRLHRKICINLKMIEPSHFIYMYWLVFNQLDVGSKKSLE